MKECRMLHIAKTFICCIMFLEIIFGFGICSAQIGVSDMYQEALWINLDLSKEQRDQIDGIILDADKQMRAVRGKQKMVDDLYKFDDLYNYADSLSQMKEIRMDAGSKITQVLPLKDREIFESQLEESQQLTEQYTMMMLQLDLTENQQTDIVKSLIKSQQRVWSVVSDTSLSWEQRRQKLKRVNAINLITGKLTTTQRSAWKKWNQSLNLMNL